MERNKVRMLLVLLLVMVSLRVDTLKAADELLTIGDTVPEFSDDVKWFGGKKQKLADYRGKKAVLLYFLKPACGSCDKFAPHLYRLTLQNEDALQVIGVSEYPNKEIKEYVKNRLGDYGVASDPQRAYINRFLGKVDKYPFVALIDKDGKLAWIGRGKFHAQVTGALEKVLGKEEPQKVITKIKKRYAILVDSSKNRTRKELQEQTKGWQKSLEENGYEILSTITCGSEDSGDAGQSAVESVKKALAEAAEKVTADDLILFYFSGDGSVVPGNKDLSLQMQQSSMKMSAIKDVLLGKEKKNHVFLVIDASHEGTKQKVWEDIAEDIGKANPQVAIMLAAARWDWSVLNADKSGTVFADLFFSRLGECGSMSTLNNFWCCLRDNLLLELRKSGKLQTPFICNPGDYSLSGKE